MSKESVGREPSSLQHGLTVLAQFEDERAVLDPTDIEWLAGVSRSTAQRCLLTLSGLGYLSRANDGSYKLAPPAARPRARRGEDGSPV